MFILRFVGRILSIGFILFIMLVLSGKNAGAEAVRTSAAAAAGHGAAHRIEAFLGASGASCWSRPPPESAQGCSVLPAQIQANGPIAIAAVRSGWKRPTVTSARWNTEHLAPEDVTSLAGRTDVKI